MPITNVVNGDLLDMFDKGDFDIIVHGANCHWMMKSGIAGQIAKRYPEAPEADKTQSDKGDAKKLGNCTVAFVERPDGTTGVILNAYTQFYPGKEDATNLYNNISNAFNRIDAFVAAQVQAQFWKADGVRIGIPYIGAGIAGGDWNTIKGIIDASTPRLSITAVDWDK